MGVAAAWILSLLAAMPAGAVNIPIAQHAIVPNTERADARGRCAIIQASQLAFIATTVDEGSMWRFLRWTPAARFFCLGDAFFAVTATGGLLRPSGDDWKSVIADGGPSESTYLGVESVAGVMYVGTGRQTWTSSDRGATWRPWLAGIGALATDGKEVFASVRGDVRHGKPGAKETVLVGKLPEVVTALGFDAGTLYAGAETGLHRSRDGGATWSKVRAPPEPLKGPPSRFTFANGSVFVQTEGFRVKVLEPGDQWKDRDDFWAILPATGGFWLQTSGSFSHVRNLGEKPQPITWPHDPFPSVTAIGVNGSKLVVGINFVEGVFVSSDGGRTWQHLCKTIGTHTAIEIDGDRLQLSPRYVRRPVCSVPGFKTRVVQALPLESCNGSLCVRWRDENLLRTRDRGRSWDDLTGKLPPDVRRGHIVLARAAGREILLGIQRHPQLPSALEIWRSIDDGATFARWDFGETVDAFSPGPDGWYVGMAARGLWRLPYAAKSP